MRLDLNSARCSPPQRSHPPSNLAVPYRNPVLSCPVLDGWEQKISEPTMTASRHAIILCTPSRPALKSNRRTNHSRDPYARIAGKGRGLSKLAWVGDMYGV